MGLGAGQDLLHYRLTEKIGEGTHVRAPVEVARLLKRVNAKIGG